MNIGRLYSDYKDEIELALLQNSAVECELYSIISSILRESESGRIISLRDVSARRTPENSKNLKGEAGFPDFVVLERDKRKNVKMFGCVEVKRLGISLEITNQIEGHINSYGKVLYTNGLEWNFFDSKNDPIWECKLGNMINNIIQWEPNKKWYELLEKIDAINWI